MPCLEALLAIWNSPTFQSIFSAAVGVVAGIGWSNRQRRLSLVALKLQYRKRLRQCFKFNLDRIDHIIALLDKNIKEIANFPLDTGLITHLMFSGDGLIGTESEYNEWNWRRYKMEHINSAMDDAVLLVLLAPQIQVSHSLAGLRLLLGEGRCEIQTSFEALCKSDAK
jgi:hypothetical protein